MTRALRTGQLADRVRIVGLRTLKAVAQRRYPRGTPDRRFVFIVGMQRSGTTTLVRVFERDLRARVFQEHSPLSKQDTERGIRLDPLDDVAHALSRVRAPLIVLKPLVETQHTPALLDRFEPSLAIWSYRHYLAVARSNVRQFGDRGGRGNLRPIVEGDPSNWRSEVVPPDVVETVREILRDDLPQVDAAALFWWVRNRLLFDLGLDTDPRVEMLRFEHFTSDPRAAVERMYDRLGVAPPRFDTTRAVDAAVARPNAQVDLDPRVRALCDELWERLTSADVVMPTGSAH